MNNKRYSGGLIQAILLLIIALVVASFFGFSPQEVWGEYLAPIFIFIWNIIVKVVNFSVETIKAGWEAFKVLVGIVKEV